MKKYVIECYGGYDHYTRAFDSKEEAERFAKLLRNLFCPNYQGIDEFDIEIIEIEQQVDTHVEKAYNIIKRKNYEQSTNHHRHAK